MQTHYFGGRCLACWASFWDLSIAQSTRQLKQQIPSFPHQQVLLQVLQESSCKISVDNCSKEFLAQTEDTSWFPEAISTLSSKFITDNVVAKTLSLAIDVLWWSQPSKKPSGRIRINNLPGLVHAKLGHGARCAIQWAQRLHYGLHDVMLLIHCNAADSDILPVLHTIFSLAGWASMSTHSALQAERTGTYCWVLGKVTVQSILASWLLPYIWS
jgi:hypothetical protein